MGPPGPLLPDGGIVKDPPYKTHGGTPSPVCSGRFLHSSCPEFNDYKYNPDLQNIQYWRLFLTVISGASVNGQKTTATRPGDGCLYREI
jgi:hypothetical protein